MRSAGVLSPLRCRHIVKHYIRSMGATTHNQYDIALDQLLSRKSFDTTISNNVTRRGDHSKE
jgi:hypothetical protein